MNLSKHAYTRHVGSQSEIPNIKIEEDGSWSISGYQVYRIKNRAIADEKAEHKKKFEAIAPFLAHLHKKRFIDIGCSSGYFGIQALLHGVTHVTFIDHDPEYVELTSKALKILDIDNCECICTQISKYKNYLEVGFAFALIHWIYSYSDNFGSLESIVSHFAKLATHTLFIEWIDPTDYAMDLAHHLTQNPERIREPYTKENFMAALLGHYSNVKKLAGITPTRELYIATNMEFK